MKYNQDTFISLRLRAMKATEKANETRLKLKYKYGDNWMICRNKAEQAKVDSADKASDKASEAFFTMLDCISPRNWRSGVSAYWVLNHLYYADAITKGQLSEAPSAGYGSSQEDILRFCRPVQKEVASSW